MINLIFMFCFDALTGVGLAPCCFVVYSSRRFVFGLASCYFVFVCYSPFGFAIASLVEVS